MTQLCNQYFGSFQTFFSENGLKSSVSTLITQKSSKSFENRIVFGQNRHFSSINFSRMVILIRNKQSSSFLSGFWIIKLIFTRKYPIWELFGKKEPKQSHLTPIFDRNSSFVLSYLCIIKWIIIASVSFFSFSFSLFEIIHSNKIWPFWWFTNRIRTVFVFWLNLKFVFI